jgi:hypothetical protein
VSEQNGACIKAAQVKSYVVPAKTGFRLSPERRLNQKFPGQDKPRRGPLPEISRFLGIIIAMYYNDHAPPHFHARYGAFEAVVAIDTGEVVEGRLPPRVLGLVQEWREYHKAELTEDWNLARDRKALKRIEPLE